MNELNNKEGEMNYAIRHGECLIYPVDKLPRGKKTELRSFIVGHSETGHHHVLESETPFTVQEKQMYIELFKPAKLVHKKTVNRHKDLVVPAGTYKIIHKQEYDPFQQIMRAVWD